MLTHRCVAISYLNKSTFSLCQKFLSNKMENREKTIVAICQMTASNDIKDNFKTVKKFVTTAKDNNAKMVFFPEGCDYISSSHEDTAGMASSLNGEIMKSYCELAKENRIWLSLGGIHEKISDDKIHNAHVIIDDKGIVAAVYRKIHLYDVNLPEINIVIKESDWTVRGNEIVAPIQTPVGRIGLEICYDLRFPELSMILRQFGAEILTFPSAFMTSTGEAHWEALLRARAIECQCYVIAAAQSGVHNSKRSSWGHSMVVDPWGAVIAQCTDDTSIAYAEIDLLLLRDIRMKMPLWDQRRNDLYPVLGSLKMGTMDTRDVYRFGQTSVNANSVFYKTELTIAFTNKSCVVPGHVLVSPIRCVPRLCDLTSQEISDLFLVTQKVQIAMEKIHSVSSSTIAIQDGQHAGQTIQHVHVHILPRRPGDFAENDQVYVELEKHDKNIKHIRNDTEMAEEATLIRSFIVT